MSKTECIGIFGGAFDPIHQDHLRIAQCALKAGYCDQVWIMPSPDRFDKHPLTSAEHRLNMVQIALENMDVINLDQEAQIKASDLEIRLGYAGTFALLEECRTLHPNAHFRLIIGADSYPNIPNWINGLDLLRQYELIVFPRKGYSMPNTAEHLAQGFAPWFDCRSIALQYEGLYASSQIRQRIYSDPHYRDTLAPGIWDYIEQNRLYL